MITAFMGTTVLFPQDCLSISKSRHRNNFTDAFNGTLIATDNAIKFFETFISYPDQARHGSSSHHGARQMYPYQARNSAVPYLLQREMSNFATFSNLPPPKDSEMTNEFAYKLLAPLSEARLGTKASGCKLVHHLPSDKKRKSRLNTKDAQLGKLKFQGCNSGLPKLQDCSAGQTVVKDPRGDQRKREDAMIGVAVRPRRSCDDILVLPKEMNHMSNITISVERSRGAESLSPKVALVKQPTKVNAVGSDPARLRRASTDPQIVEHLGYYKSQISGVQGNALTRTTSLSLPERWAGPGYTASPAPSALPLPKFSLLNQKIPSRRVLPLLVEQGKHGTTESLEVRSVSAAPGFCDEEGELDVAFATMSLRRMLKLDPPNRTVLP